eukprot:m.242584 g.242584  ORF g.242584 m.242584 type:complete len:194 (+) comp33799_c0_seq2:1052-1633(+)
MNRPRTVGDLLETPLTDRAVRTRGGGGVAGRERVHWFRYRHGCCGHRRHGCHRRRCRRCRRRRQHHQQLLTLSQAVDSVANILSTKTTSRRLFLISIRLNSLLNSGEVSISSFMMRCNLASMVSSTSPVAMVPSASSCRIFSSIITCKKASRMKAMKMLIITTTTNRWNTMKNNRVSTTCPDTIAKPSTITCH